MPFADSPEFQRLLAGNDHVDLARVALEIGRDAYPEIDIEAYLEKIRTPRGSCSHPVQARLDVREILGQINWVLFVEEEFRGNRKTTTTRGTAISTKCSIAASEFRSPSRSCTGRWPSNWALAMARASICRCISCCGSTTATKPISSTRFTAA